MEGGDSEFAKFTVPTLKAFLKASSQSVSGNKQELVARAIGCQRTHFFHALAIRGGKGEEKKKKKKNRCKDRFPPILHHLLPVILANATLVE